MLIATYIAGISREKERGKEKLQQSKAKESKAKDTKKKKERKKEKRSMVVWLAAQDKSGYKKKKSS